MYCAVNAAIERKAALRRTLEAHARERLLGAQTLSYEAARRCAWPSAIALGRPESLSGVIVRQRVGDTLYGPPVRGGIKTPVSVRIRTELIIEPVTEDLRQRDVSKLPDAAGPYTPKSRRHPR
jgi:hypothetical protein